MKRFAIALLLAVASTTAQAEVIAASATVVSSSLKLAFELHDDVADENACGGRSGFPSAMVGEIDPRSRHRVEADQIKHFASGCWWPNGDGSITVFLRHWQSGQPVELVLNANDFWKSEHFTDWNLAPAAAAVPVRKVRPVLRDSFGGNGTMEVRLDLDTHMNCYGVPGKTADISLSKPGQDAFGVKGCWIDNGDYVSVMINNPGAPPIVRDYSVTSFSYE